MLCQHLYSCVQTTEVVEVVLDPATTRGVWPTVASVMDLMTAGITQTKLSVAVSRPRLISSSSILSAIEGRIQSHKYLYYVKPSLSNEPQDHKKCLN